MRPLWFQRGGGRAPRRLGSRVLGLPHLPYPTPRHRNRTPRPPMGRTMTLTGPIVPHEWATNAACAKFPTHQTDPIFFPAKETPKTTDAQNLCATCPARQPCAEYAIESNEPHGIWGGLTATDRDKIRAERKARK